jgi:hypothetical protein
MVLHVLKTFMYILTNDKAYLTAPPLASLLQSTISQS